MKLASLLLAGAFCALPLAASAQWTWLDAGGRKVFSDKAPPPEVPERNIIKRPGGTVVRSTAPSAPAAAAAPAALSADAPADAPPNAAAASPGSASGAAAGARPPVGQDKELLERTRQAEAAEAQRKKAEADQLARARADNCNRARQAKASLDSGVRIAQVNAKGEREIMDDAARAAEARRVQQTIQADCAAR
ncbi:MAG: DUF4124 domain-containing protein [Burkholderiaceae bacterium]|nr:DUF4124 domain-containing protein [Burkholderiaceae bacterium]